MRQELNVRNNNVKASRPKRLPVQEAKRSIYTPSLRLKILKGLPSLACVQTPPPHPPTPLPSGKIVGGVCTQAIPSSAAHIHPKGGGGGMLHELGAPYLFLPFSYFATITLPFRYFSILQPVTSSKQKFWRSRVLRRYCDRDCCETERG